MEHPVQVIYLDVLFVPIGANFLFDWLLLWATAEVTKTAATRWRLMCGALLGTAHYALYLLSAYGAVGLYGLLRFPLTVGLVSLIMLAIAFFPALTARRILQLAGTFYVILFVSAGAGLAVGNVLANGGSPSELVIHAAAIGALLLVAELGWGVVQRRIWRSLYLVPIEIALMTRNVRVVALVDTGNTLRDPLTRAPVIPVEIGALRALFPDALWEDVVDLTQGDFAKVSGMVAHSQWSSRLRLIPFTSLGKEHGLLVGFKPDAIRILLPQMVEAPKGAIIGLAQHILDREGQYQALVHPSLLESAETARGVNARVGYAGPSTASIQSSKGGNTVVDTTP